MPDEEEKIEVAVGPDFKPLETQPLTALPEEPVVTPTDVGELLDGESTPVENWWAAIEDEDAFKEHERVKPWLEEAQDKARKESYNRLQPLILKQQNTLAELSNAGGKMYKEVQRAARDGALDEELLERWENLGAQAQGIYWAFGSYEGAKRIAEYLGRVAGDDTIGADFRARLDIVEQGGGEDADLYNDLYKRLTKAATAKDATTSEKKGYDKGVADGRKAAIEEIRARQRENNGPDLSRKQTAGGTALSPERYKSMTADERLKLTPAQIDAMTAELARMSR